MADIELGAVQERFADIVWAYEPIGSGELVKLCSETLGWKKSTTFTVLKKLCDRGIFVNEKGIVRSQMNKQQFYAAQSCQYVENTFSGSLPAFLAAFSSSRPLSDQEIEEIRGMLDAWQGSGR